MLCGRCGKRKVTAVVFEVAAEGVRGLPVCGDCLIGFSGRRRLPNVAVLSTWLEAHFSPEDCGRLFREKCPACGWSFGNYLRAGSAGCLYCRRHFAPLLVALGEWVDRDQEERPCAGGGREGPSRIPSGRREAAQWTQAVLSPQVELAYLKERLEALIRDERYEEAKKLSEQIRALERKKE